MQNNQLNPFFALEVTRDGLNKEFSKQNLITKPNISEEQFEEYEEIIGNSIMNNTTINIVEFNLGEPILHVNSVKKYDAVTKELVLDNKARIKLKNIIDVSNF